MLPITLMKRQRVLDERWKQTPYFLKSCILKAYKHAPGKDLYSKVKAAWAICKASLEKAGRIVKGKEELTAKGDEKEKQYSKEERKRLDKEFDKLLKQAKKQGVTAK